MTGVLSPDDTVAGLARFLRVERIAILQHWRSRLARLPVGRSLSDNGVRGLEWLAASLDERSEPTLSGAVVLDETFSAPRTIAELALLVETIDRLRPSSEDEARAALHRLIDGAIARSLLTRSFSSASRAKKITRA